MKRQKYNQDLMKLGNRLKEYRLMLNLNSSSREYFISNREELKLVSKGWISTKALTNIELGYNLPSLTTIKLLSVALEIDFGVLMNEIYDYIPL